jgi:hypothetical protein
MPSLIGNKPNQVPTNGDLGSMAFREQDQFYSSQQTMGFKNRFINGNMAIAQRGTSAVTNNDTFPVDRWLFQCTVNSRLSLQQNLNSITPPVGFTNYLGITTTTSYSVGSSDSNQIQQRIEGFNFSDLGFGTANAQPVTISFWVRSSLTGTFGGVLRNGSFNRSYPFTYTISAANTWEQKFVTIAGDTTGTWNSTNGTGAILSFGLGVGLTFSGTAGSWAASGFTSATGATSVVGTSGATFYITGVQLEKGSTATSFDYRPYGTELNLCQRYLPVISAGGYNGNGSCSATNRAYALFSLPVTPRVAPTGIVSTAVSTFTVDDFTTGVTATGVLFAAATPNYALVRFDTASVLTQYRPIIINFGGSGSIQFTGCEL